MKTSSMVAERNIPARTSGASAHRTRTTRIELDDGRPPQAHGERIRNALARADIVHVAARPPVSDARAHWDAIVRYVGERKPLDEDAVTFERTGRTWLDVRFDPQRQHTFRHSCTAQPLHTDGAYDRDPADVIFFFCERQAPASGETLFLHGIELVSLLEREDPKLLEQLRARPVTFTKGDGGRKEATVIADDAEGPVLCWNYYRADARDREERGRIERFRSFLEERVVAAGRALPIRLEPGEAVFFHDARTLHGRRAFEATRLGDRLLWKGGLRLADGA